MQSDTFGALLKEGAALLYETGVAAPEHDAKALLAHVLGGKLNDVLLRADEQAEPELARTYWHLIALRARRMPLQYVTRSTEFCGLQLKVDDRALVPRPETEELAEAVAERLWRLEPGLEDYVVDVGCGSGAIGLCLALQGPPMQVVMTDVSQDALHLTAENATRLGVTDRVILLQGPYLQPVWQGGLEHGVVAVVSNPPYVRPDEMETLEPEVLAEPRMALESSTADGLEAYRVIISEAKQLTRLRLLAFEVGHEQAREVAKMLEGLGDVEILEDFAGIERIVIAHVDH
jgi:release factor glutamine methyltransferase